MPPGCTFYYAMVNYVYLVQSVEAIYNQDLRSYQVQLQYQYQVESELTCLSTPDLQPLLKFVLGAM